MKELFVKYEAFINSLRMKDRVLLLGFFCLIIFVVWFLFFLPVKGYGKKITFDLIRIREQMEEQKRVALANFSTLSKEELQKSLQLASPAELPKVLEQLATTDKKLRLTKLQSALPEQLSVISDKKLIRFGIEMTFKGDYFSTLGYLKKIESIWQPCRDKLEYRVVSYPRAEVEVSVHAIGESQK
jgi:hypothetical protein